MKEVMLIVWALIIIAVAIILAKFIIKKLVFKVVVIGVALCLLLGGIGVINVSVLPTETKGKIQQVVDVVGESYIKTKGNDVYIKIDNEWYDVSEMSVVGSMATDSITIRYQGEEIEIGQSGVVNVIKTLEKVGLLNNSNSE